MYGTKGGALEDFILCASCKFEVFGYVLEEMVDCWNELIKKRVGFVGLRWISSGAYEELPCMELLSRK